MNEHICDYPASTAHYYHRKCVGGCVPVVQMSLMDAVTQVLMATWPHWFSHVEADSRALQRSKVSVGGALAPVTDTEMFWPAPQQMKSAGVKTLPLSHFLCWEPHMLMISLNTSHHLTHQTVALLTDSTDAKKKWSALNPSLSPPPSIPSSPFPDASFYSSCVCCHLLSSSPPRCYFLLSFVPLYSPISPSIGWTDPGWVLPPLPPLVGSVKLELEEEGLVEGGML